MGKAQEKRDAAEKAAAKKAEKDAKKAALKEARAAKKAIKAEKKAACEAPLDGAVRAFGAALELAARWRAVGDAVGRSPRARARAPSRSRPPPRGPRLGGRARAVRRFNVEAVTLDAASKAAVEAAAKEAFDARLRQSAAAAAAETRGASDAMVAEAMGAVSKADDGAAADRLAASGVVATFAAPPVKKHRNCKDINVSNLTVTFHGAPILEGTDFVLNWGNRYGFIGRNGSGKSTLMRAVGARAIPIPESIDIYHLTTEYPATEETALYAVMKVDAERAAVEREIDELNDAMAELAEADDDEAAEDATERLTVLYERLEELDSATAETRACAILTGLGFSPERQQQKTRDFSGGWRMRVALARALFIQPALLLLDEPTNHLDMEAVVWLEDYLSRWTKMLFMVCHSQDFLNNVCTHVVHLDAAHRRLAYYRGNYDMFVETRRDAAVEQLKKYDAEQADIKAMKEYVAKFGHGNSKMAKQGKSKEKLLTKKLASGLTEKPVEEMSLKFRFPDPGHIPPPVLQVNDLTFGYPGCPALYEGVEFGLDLDSRIALVGPNGAGKSTLVKIINGELTPRLGQVRPHGHLKMSKFTQHFEDILDLTMTPLDWFMGLYTELTREDARKWLGRYGTSGVVQMQVMSQLSEGQKAKVVFCKMAKESAHLLLLDEPTNALDMEMIDSLADAIKHFSGGVVLVSHDMRLISQVAEEIWIIDKGVSKYTGDILNFKMDLRKQMQLDDGARRKGASPRTSPKLAPGRRAGAAVVPPRPGAAAARAARRRRAAAGRAQVPRGRSRDAAPARYVPPGRRAAARASARPGDAPGERAG
ncbi:ABC transporter [Aureococcus anophagefferens]|uniref:ABC transporter n=1 Tax=Aureococcus anophagefferens TaxID=44056 RepID=A0ABR1G5F7_AURAN